MLKKQRDKITHRLEAFSFASHSKEIRFEHLNARQRKLLCQLSRKTGLVATPSRKGKSRVVVVTRQGHSQPRGKQRKAQAVRRAVPFLELSDKTKTLLNDFWLSHSCKPKADTQPTSSSSSSSSSAAASSESPLPSPSPAQTEEYLALQDFRKNLPSYASREEIVSAVRNHSVTVICGPTGCGKSTQVPQFILEEFPQSVIVATQPRRISATSLAERIAQERGEALGKSVGYQIRLEGKRSAYTRLLLCTVGILLRRCVDDPLLQGVTHVVVDEVHERDRLADFLLIILKDLLLSGKRPDLKVILMSATVDGERFAAYLNGGQVVQLTGRTFPVEQVFLEDVLQRMVTAGVKLPRQKESSRKPPSDQVGSTGRPFPNGSNYSEEVSEYLHNSDAKDIDFELIAQIVSYICTNFPLVDNKKGAILIFLTGWAEITATCDLLRALNLPLWVLPLHSSIPSQQQQLVFKSAPSKLRKVVVSTNIAETSVTIDDIVFVIDSGKANELTFQSALQMSSLKPQTISRASAAQRRGRAGRCQAGIVYHLFTSSEHETFAEYQLPEILRTPLEELCLQIKLQWSGPVAPFLAKALDPPDINDIGRSVALLKALGALDALELLTPLGQQLARLPCSPRLGKMILLGHIFGCLDPVLTIACCLAHRSPFILPLPQQRQDAQKARDVFSQRSFSDHLTVLRAFNEWQALPPGARWNFCRTNFLSNIGLGMIADIKKQFIRNLAELGYEGEVTLSLSAAAKSECPLSLVRAIVSAGMNPNFALIESSSKRPVFVTLHHRHAKIHPGSVNAAPGGYPERVMAFFEMVQTKQLYLRTTSLVSPVAVILFSGRPHSGNDEKQSEAKQVDPDLPMDPVIEALMTKGFPEMTREEKRAKAREQQTRQKEKEKHEKAAKLARQREAEAKVAQQAAKNEKFLLQLDGGSWPLVSSSDEDDETRSRKSRKKSESGRRAENIGSPSNVAPCALPQEQAREAKGEEKERYEEAKSSHPSSSSSSSSSVPYVLARELPLPPIVGDEKTVDELLDEMEEEEEEEESEEGEEEEEEDDEETEQDLEEEKAFEEDEEEDEGDDDEEEAEGDLDMEEWLSGGEEGDDDHSMDEEEEEAFEAAEMAKHRKRWEELDGKDSEDSGGMDTEGEGDEEEEAEFVRSMSQLIQDEGESEMAFHFHSDHFAPVSRNKRGNMRAHIIEVNPVIRFRTTAKTKEQLEFVVEALQEFISRKIKDPLSPGDDTALLQLLSAILLEEDRCADLQEERFRGPRKPQHRQGAKRKKRFSRRDDDTEDFSLLDPDLPRGNLTRQRGWKQRGGLEADSSSRGGGGGRGRGASQGGSSREDSNGRGRGGSRGASRGASRGGGRGGRGRGGSRGGNKGGSRGGRGGSRGGRDSKRTRKESGKRK